MLSFSVLSLLLPKSITSTRILQKQHYARSGSRVRGIQDLTGKDIVLGGLFTVYYTREGTGANEEECGNAIFQPGIE